MSGVLKGIGIVAGLVALTATGIGAFASAGTIASIGASLGASVATIGQVASAVALVANVASQLTASKPPVQGSTSQIAIGANMPSPCLIGESYFGGCRVKQVGYGEEDKVPNAHAWVVDIYSVAGPLTALLSSMCDFVPVSFIATPDNNALGYFHNNLHRHYHLGATPEPAALVPHWFGAPNWTSASKLSGLAAIGWSARWPKDGKVFAAGFPQTGAIWQGVPAYDPRDDDSYPGGSGPQRWADPADAPAFAAAKPTWPYTRNPGLHALRYCVGSWERQGSDPFQKVFGVGYKIDQVVVEDFVELANVCDANGWTVNGMLFEGQGVSKWDNLKRVLAAGGAVPVWKGGRLGLRINAPRIALATITLDDIAEGEPIIPGTMAFETRKNTLIPKWIDPASKWESVPSAPVQITEYVDQDGEERSEEFVLDLVTNATQAAQLAGYELVSRREQGPITLPLKPKFRHFPAGSLFELDPAVMAEFGIRESQVLAINKTTDIQAMSWTFNLATETETKHAYALGLTGTSPPVPYIPSSDDLDGAAYGAAPDVISATIRAANVIGGGMSGEADGDTGKIIIGGQNWDYPGAVATVDRAGGVITGLDLATRYFVYFDDDTLANETPTYSATLAQIDAINSVANPARHYLGLVDIPGDGEPPTDGDGSGGGGGCPHEAEPIQMADTSFKPAGQLQVGDMVWAKHEITGVWGAYPVEAVELFDCDDMYEGEVRGHRLRASGSHLLWHYSGWRMFRQLGQRVEAGRAVKIQVRDAHTYVVSGLLSHNKLVNPDG